MSSARDPFSIEADLHRHEDEMQTGSISMADWLAQVDRQRAGFESTLTTEADVALIRADRDAQ